MTPAHHARLSSLFHEAVELEPTQRAALLERVHREDPALAADLVALLVADRFEVSGLATGQLADLAADGSGEATTAVATPDIGALVDAPPIAGFTVMGILGRGGMGTVFEARQHAPARDVALKVLHATSHASLARFHAEIDIMARLDHPGIAKIYAAGQAAGHPYFVMERVKGVTLDDRVPALSRRERLSLFAAVCDAVHHAHVKGVFHRDLKPSNLMVRDDGGVAVLDFGIARLAVGDHETRAGELVGTPLYMSPEQARLRADEVDARSDVYTLGVIVYELLSGELPYAIRGRPLTAIARVICEEPARLLSAHDGALRGDLEAICDRALQKEPERRYPSAAALAEDIRAHLAGQRVSVRVPGTLEALRRFVRRRPAAAAAVVGVASIGLVATMLWLDARAAWRMAETERARVLLAHAALEERTNQLVLDQARAALALDPTRSLELLRTLTPRGVDAAVAWAIADEAFGRGVASAVLRGHTGEARWIEPVPGGGFVSGGYDGRALRWAAGVATVLGRREGRVHVVRPAPDGRRFALGFDGGVAHVVDASGTLIASVSGLAGDVERLAWSPDGSRLALAGDRGTIALWPADPIDRRVDVKSGVESLAWSSDGTQLAVGTDDGMLWIVDGEHASTRRVTVGSEVLAVSVVGDRVAALGASGTLQRWRRVGEHLQPVATIASELAGKTAAFSPDGTRAILGGVDGRVVVIDGDVVTRLPSHSRQVRAVAASPRGDRFATASDDGSTRVWDLARGRSFSLRGHIQRVRQLAFTITGDELLSADSEGVLRRWDLAQIPPSVFEPAGPIARIAVSSDARTLVTSGEGGELRSWDLATGGERRLGEHTRVTALAVHAGVISADADGALVWWQTVPARQQAPGPVRGLAVSADGRFVAAATSTGAITLYGGGGTPIATLAGHAEGSDAVAFSPDGKLLVSGGQDRVVRVWDPAVPGAPSRELGPIGGDTRHVVFARRGGVVATAGDDGVVRTWQVRAGSSSVDAASHRVVFEHRGAVIGLASDGADRLVSVGRDRQRVEIDLATGTTRRQLAAAAAQPIEGGFATLRAVPLPIASGRDLVISVDGRTATIHASEPRDLAALRALLDQR